MPGLPYDVLRPGAHGLVLLLAVTTTACSSTRLATDWYDPGAEAVPIRKLLVMASEARSTADRIQLEATLATRLSQQPGVRAEPLKDHIPLLGEADLEKVKAMFEDRGYDAVLVVRLIDVQQKVESRVSSGSITYAGFYRRYFGPSSGTEVVSREVVSLETNLHRIPGYGLLWTARTESVDVETPQRLADELGDLVAKRLQELGHFGPS